MFFWWEKLFPYQPLIWRNKLSITFFGELMLRLTPAQPQQRLMVAQQLSVDFAGAEANVAAALARLGVATDFITKLPDNLIAEQAIASLHRCGIATNNVLFGGERMGTYFIELGASLRPTRVIYDRKYSAISTIVENEFNWNEMLQSKQRLHLSGITPALSEQCALETIKAAKIAHGMGVRVSFDLNFRRSLWPEPAFAKHYFKQIMQYCDLVFANAGVISDVFEYQFFNSDVLVEAQAVAEFLGDEFNVDAAVTSRIHHSASVNSLTSLLRKNADSFKSTELRVDILDRLGTGDAFAAGVLYGYQQAWSAQQTIDFANAAFALAHNCYGDQAWMSEAEINEVARGNTAGYVVR
ncbi:sugar kinase [Cellvibrio sp. pealriver]|uniref:sugar kinase n=1 Tax=Cellvibrio sp. pealriver TaxID=1622269 RepID=UPI0021010224|nr:sugar kinase [Cellvibrio sp. pealriver]